ncbi:MAG: hypothetical protein WC729_01005 [Sphingomonas sp.]|jgi:hypothetical protein|uniref:hypothetical protein n=1 Tax=Sphingomonas sp. TaxID=28214 RepID=UPI0035682047
MRDPALPLLLLGVSTGLMAGASGRHAALLAGIAAALLVSTFGPIVPDGGSHAMAWVCVMAIAGATWLPRGVPIPVAGAAGAAAGLLHAGTGATLLSLALLVASALLAGIAARRGWRLAVQVVASWLFAVAALNVTLGLLPVTPGYLPDHLE